jgi:hypothetical protein
VTETKRCGGYEGHWECADEYPGHMVPVDRFSIRSASKDGLQWACKDCYKIRDNKRDPIRNSRISAAEKLVGSRKEFRSMTKEGRDEIYSQLDENVVDIKPKLKSEFGQSTPMTKREISNVVGEAVPEGWVYVTRNPDVPWVLKIGKTFPDGVPDIMSSARRFGRSELVDKFWFEEAYKAEQSIHALLKLCNLRTLGHTDCGTELFKCTIEEAMDAITKVQSGNDRPSIAVGE